MSDFREAGALLNSTVRRITLRLRMHANLLDVNRQSPLVVPNNLLKTNSRLSKLRGAENSPEFDAGTAAEAMEGAAGT